MLEKEKFNKPYSEVAEGSSDTLETNAGQSTQQGVSTISGLSLQVPLGHYKERFVC